MMIKKYLEYIKENENSDNSTKFKELVDGVKEMIETTVKNKGGEFNTFVDTLVKDPDNVKIEGLINDSDLYDFYLKYGNDIDQILNENKYYDKSPGDMEIYGLYDYLIKGTNFAIIEAVKLIATSSE
jgi:hypothetical protein